MIKVEAIDEDNVYDILKLKVSDSQKEFVATNAVSLAECYVYRDNNDVFPYAIINDDEPIGFLLLETYEEYDALSIWRFMTDHKHQGQGLGFKAMKAIIDFGRTHFPTTILRLRLWKIIPQHDRFTLNWVLKKRVWTNTIKLPCLTP